MKVLILFLSLNALAGASREVLIRGKIGNQFDEKKVKVVDSEGQIYFLPRHLFPKNVPIKTNEPFSIEIDEKELNNLKLLKK